MKPRFFASLIALLFVQAAMAVGQSVPRHALLDAHAITALPASGTQPDLDGDGAADLGVFLSSSGAWTMRQSGDGRMFSGGPVAWGPTALPFPGDYDGDGLADFAVYAVVEAGWYILRSTDGLMLDGGRIHWGAIGGTPVPQDYDGDGTWDLASYTAVDGKWTIRSSSDRQILGGAPIVWGPHAIPVPADYDGDGLTDIAVYTQSSGTWTIRQSSNGQTFGGAPIVWGPASIPVPADYDGDGRADLAVYASADGKWYVKKSSDGQMLEGAPIQWGASVAVPVPNDYDGDGRADLGVYVSKNGKWYIRKSSDGTLMGGGNTVKDGILWPSPRQKNLTPASSPYQTLRLMGLFGAPPAPPLPLKATSPSPANGATSQTINVTLSWSGGVGAASYDVTVNGQFVGNQTGTSYNPGTLPYSTAYAWRIDCKNSSGTTHGDPWTFTTEASTLPPPADMPLIPGGSFAMGDAFTAVGDGNTNELPVHTVTLGAFYIGRTEVTKSLWDQVRAWGLSHGYTDLPEGAGKAQNHPVQSITWHAMVKWCNARSQMEGRPVCYTWGGQVYKTGQHDPACNWAAVGYRLPTEAEREKAGRGGIGGHRFAWSDSDTISHTRANYNSASEFSYDTSATRGYHPAYTNGAEPYTSPVGSFASNEYGLYDMAGNVWEACWDWYEAGYYGYSASTNPHGPDSGDVRVIRGGSWANFADNCRVSDRYKVTPDEPLGNVGLRVVLPLGP